MSLFNKKEKSPEEKLVKKLVGGFLSSNNLLVVLKDTRSQDRLKDIVTSAWKNGASAQDIQKVYDENLARLKEYKTLNSEKRRAKREEEIPKIIFDLKSKPKEEKKGFKKVFSTTIGEEFVKILSGEYLNSLDDEMAYALEGTLKKVQRDGGTLEDMYNVFESNIDFVEKKDARLKNAQNNIFGEKIRIGDVIFHMPSKYKGRMKSAGKIQGYLIDTRVIDVYELIDSNEDDEVVFKIFEHGWSDDSGENSTFYTQSIGIKVYKHKDIGQVLSDLENSDKKWIIENSLVIGEYSGYEILKKDGFLDHIKTLYFLSEKDGKTVLIFAKGVYDYKHQSCGPMNWEDIIKEIIS